MTTVAASTGRLITPSVQPCQNVPLPRPRSSRERRTTRWPSSEISAGSRVTAASIATATTRIAPSAIDRIAVLSTIHSPASETITVSPLNSTASPEVASATPRASSCERPPATSSR